MCRKRSPKAPGSRPKPNCRMISALLSRRGRGHSAALQCSPGSTPGALGELSKQASAGAAQTCLGRVTSQLTSGRQLGRPRGFLLLLSVPPIKGACSPADARSYRVRQTVSKAEAKDSCPCEAKGQKPKLCTLCARGASQHHAPVLCASVSHACETQLDESGCAAARASAASKCAAMRGTWLGMPTRKGWHFTDLQPNPSGKRPRQRTLIRGAPP